MEEPPNEWIVLELSPRSEREDPDVVRQAILQALGGEGEVFLPAAVTQIGEDRVVHYLMDGYAFVHRTHSDATYLRLEGTRFVQSVLTEPGSNRHRRLATVKTSDIDRMRRQIVKEVDQGIGVGDTVRITSGPYRNIEAKVVEEIPEEGTVQVYVELRSKRTIVNLPRSFLQVIDRAPMARLRNRLQALQAWTKMAYPVLKWDGEPDYQGLQWRFKTYSQFDHWVDRGRKLHSFVTFVGYHGLEKRFDALRQRFSTYSTLHTTTDQMRKLYSFILAYHDSAPVNETRIANIHAKFLELVWFDDVLDRMRTLGVELEDLGHALASRHGEAHVVDNLIIDGHNLAFRCLYAPGMSALSDSQGRPTGMILGFLRSLGSLKKRWKDATIYVTWDGTSRRRKSKFADYKGNRPSHTANLEGFDQLGYLRQILSQLNVRQAWNPEEEADDVIAALVRGQLSGQQNLIFSTDRDLLQLVTETTRVLVPGTGARKEILFDRTLVKDHYGVEPDRMVHLRAFFGDTSDNIPGVPRVPKKVLTSLVQAYGSVDKVYESGFTGLSRGQYERLRSAEPQVRINVELMSLVDVPVSVAPPDVDPDGAATRLRDVGINPTPILAALLGRTETAA